MRMSMIEVLVVSVAALAVAVPAAAQDQGVGQAGSVWNLGELQPRAYPSTVTAVNKSCPGPHDFHVSIEGEATEFLNITGPTILTDIPPGRNKTSDVVFNLRNTAPGPPNGSGQPLRWIRDDGLPATVLVHDAVGEGLAELEFAGTGHAAGEIFTITMTRNAETPFEMGFPLGTIVVPEDSSTSPMIGADNGAVALLDDVTVVYLSGYSLAPNLELPPTAEEIDDLTEAVWSDVQAVLNAGKAPGR